MFGVKGKKELMILTVCNKTKITKTGKVMAAAGLKKDVEAGVDDMKEGD
jgi:hypothetical protein